MRHVSMIRRRAGIQRARAIVHAEPRAPQTLRHGVLPKNPRGG